MKFGIAYNSDKQTEKWFWMMKYCKDNKIPPAQKWAWDEAGKKYNELNAL